jgi:hypothetical protein
MLLGKLLGHDIFISYSRADKGYAMAVCSRVRPPRYEAGQYHLRERLALWRKGPPLTRVVLTCVASRTYERLYRKLKEQLSSMDYSCFIDYEKVFPCDRLSGAL